MNDRRTPAGLRRWCGKCGEFTESWVSSYGSYEKCAKCCPPPELVNAFPRRDARGRKTRSDN